MNSYFIESFKIDKLWGYRDIDLTFNKDVNILIGPNGSGKTTILNLLHSILTADLRSISNVNFEQAKIRLRSFKGSSVRTIKVDVEYGLLKFKVGQETRSVFIGPLSDRRPIRPDLRHVHEGNSIIRRMLSEELDGELTAVVPLVWLPISRRLPVTEEEEERYAREKPLESVDVRLEELLEGLSHYYSRLNTRLSERYKEFEHQVLSVILYSKEHDQLNLLPTSLPTEAEKKQLLNAFEAAGLLDEQMQIRINDHFDAAEATLKRIRADEKIGMNLEDILVVPLIGRTKAMVGHAGKLEEDRENIFASLRHYEKTVNSFLNDKSLNKGASLNGKSVKVDEDGDLKIESSSSSNLNWRYLSSGEKQILILLTQALLKVDEPVVYIADEPELSLHVTWQDKLLESLVKLGGQMQVIVATHSPDIVGKFQDNVIDLGRQG